MENPTSAPDPASIAEEGGLPAGQDMDSDASCSAPELHSQPDENYLFNTQPFKIWGHCPRRTVYINKKH